MIEQDGLAGYAGIIGNALLPLNNLALFRKRYGRTNCRFILDSPYWLYAAGIVVDRGTLSVHGLRKDVAGYMREIDESDGYVRMSTYDYLAFAGGRMSVATLIKRWFSGKIILAKPFRLLRLLRMYHILRITDQKALAQILIAR
ncbi:MAG: hypothetical protein PHY31_08020 [Smithellaceae bacterium]|nr:hypothetical protein [Smithellaceae bacterium]